MNQSKLSSRPVALWLLTGVLMIIIQIILGGITRLTGSGLSITEWDVITGALPPLSDLQWQQEFHKYQQTPQYRLLNYDFTLSNFKFIFFWEWIHRLWARLIGLVFFIPFVVFLVQRRFRTDMIKPLIILFLLGALQGLVGWIMVASGLTGDAVYVKPTRLALHFVFALFLLSYTFWFFLRFVVRRNAKVHSSWLKNFTWIIIGVLFLQLIFGALMAGHKAATSAPTWPDINGEFIPSAAVDHSHGMVDLLENKITIHFVHRMLGYSLVVLVILWTIYAYKRQSTTLFSIARMLPLFFILIQLTLGIATVLTSLKIVPGQWGTFEWMALFHQLVAMLLLLSLLFATYLLNSTKKTNYPTPAFDPHVI